MALSIAAASAVHVAHAEPFPDPSPHIEERSGGGGPRCFQFDDHYPYYCRQLDLIQATSTFPQCSNMQEKLDFIFFKYTGIYFRSDYYGEYLVDSHGFRIYIHCFHARYCINHLKKLQQQNNIKSFNWILHQDHLPALGCSKSQGCVKPGLWTSCHARTQEQRKLNKPFSDPIVCE